MKPLLFSLCSLFFAGTSFALPLKRVMPDINLPRSTEQTFEFIFKLDSLNYRSGKVHLKCKLVNRFNRTKHEKVNAKYGQISDSLYSVRIKGKTYLLNTKSGQVIDSKKGWIVYRNSRFRILESEKRASHGTDSLGTYIAYFGNFRSEIPSKIIYDPKPLATGKTVQYKIHCTPLINDFDSSWIEKDTTRIIRQYDGGKLISERTERMSAYHFPEIVEYQYSISGDTTMQMLTHFEDGYGGEYPSGIYMTISPSLLVKKVYVLYENKSHQYQYIDSKKTISTEVTDKSWKYTECDGVLYSQTFRQISYKEHFGHYQILENTCIRFSAKK